MIAVKNSWLKENKDGNVSIDVKCMRCQSSISFRIEYLSNGSLIIHIDDCEDCIEDVYEEAYQDGYNDGVEDG